MLSSCFMANRNSSDPGLAFDNYTQEPGHKRDKLLFWDRDQEQMGNESTQYLFNGYSYSHKP